MLTKAEKALLRAKISKKKELERKKVIEREKKKAAGEVTDPEIQAKYDQFYYFMQDCLLPMMGQKTSYVKIWKTYLRYCSAVGIDPLFTQTFFSRCLSKHFLKDQTRSGTKYYLIVREQIFVTPGSERNEPIIQVPPEGL